MKEVVLKLEIDGQVFSAKVAAKDFETEVQSILKQAEEDENEDFKSVEDVIKGTLRDIANQLESGFFYEDFLNY